MWELRLKSPLDYLSGRRLFVCVSALLVSLCISLFLLAAPVQAAPGDPADWAGDTITYDGETYKRPEAGIQAPVAALKDVPYYVSTTRDTPPTGTSEPKLRVIYFAKGSSPQEVEAAVSATFAEYTYNEQSQLYENSGDGKNITITPRSDSQQGQAESTSCDGRYLAGTGWFVCGITRFIAKGTDVIFNLVAGFLAVQPLQTSQDGPIYRAWSMMRGFANVAFVIAFMIIIYSQLTSFGLSNYGLKKLVPRLIAAAILVNVSYWICSIAVDASNILGYSLQDVFIGLRENLLGPGQGNNFQVWNFETATQLILSAGAGAAGLGLTFALGPELIGGAIFMLIPVLIGAIAAVIIALVVLAARQAIITILIVVSPLAFVAFLLPSTNKYFDKWKDLFLTLLIVFPAFSVVFGGSQLAGAIIIQNASSMFVILFGMAVQIIPLAITPLLLRLGGGVLNRIAGIVNNPSKGLVDRSKTWAKEARLHKNAQNRANPYNNGLFTNISRTGVNRKKRRADWAKRYEERENIGYQESAGYEPLYKAEQDNKKALEVVHAQHQSEYDAHLLSSPTALQGEIEYKATLDSASLQKAKYDAMIEAAKTGKVLENDKLAGHTISTNPQLAQSLTDYQTVSRGIAATALSTTQSQIQQSIEKNRALEQNTETIDGMSLRDYAGGVRGEAGAQSVFTSAIAAARADEDKSVAEKGQLMQHFNFASDDNMQLAYGLNGQKPSDVTKQLRDDAGNVTEYTFKVDDDYATEAATIQVFKAGSAGEKRKLILESGINPETGEKGITYKHRKVVAEQIVQNGIPGKMLSFGSKAINDIAQGKFYGEQSESSSALYNLVDGKIVDETLATQTPDSVKALFGTMNLINSPDDNKLKTEFYAMSQNKQDAYYRNFYAMAKSGRDIEARQVNRNSDRATLDLFVQNANTYANEIDLAEARDTSEADRRKKEREKDE